MTEMPGEGERADLAPVVDGDGGALGVRLRTPTPLERRDPLGEARVAPRLGVAGCVPLEVDVGRGLRHDRDAAGGQGLDDRGLAGAGRPRDNDTPHAPSLLRTTTSS